MTNQLPPNLHLSWREPFSRDELDRWAKNHMMPRSLYGKHSYPAVYRFIFPESRDANSSHTPCYIGEAKNLSQRLARHFKAGEEFSKNPDGKWGAPTGWRVRGAILNSIGQFVFQVLEITGKVNFNCMTFEADTIPPPLHNVFIRRLLENWALLYSEWADHLHPLNSNWPREPGSLHDALKRFRKETARATD
jgi:hypothetical protein